MATRTSLLKDLKERFDRERIDLPYQRMLVKDDKNA